MSSIDDYLAKFPAAEQAALNRICSAIVEAYPDIEEAISNGMPGFKYQGKYLCGFMAFKDHLSFFPTARPIEVLNHELSAYKLSKGTIQFAVESPLPERLIKKLVHVRVDDIVK